MQPSYKSLEFEVTDLKAAGDGWKFAGWAATFGNVDEGGDVILRGAFTDSLRRRPRPKLLWQHNIGEPLGTVLDLREDERGLFGEFKISRTARGSDAYQLLKDGAVDSMSIGYIAEDAEFTDDGIRKLKAIDLLEISVVTIPMNAEALITSIKAATRDTLAFSAHAGLVLDEVRLLIQRYEKVLQLRVEKGRVPGEEIRRLMNDLKALVAEVDVPELAIPEVPEQKAEPGLSGTMARLEIARRRLVLTGA